MKPYKLLLSAMLTAGVLTLLFFGCQKETKKLPSVTSDAKGGSQSTNVYDTLKLSCAGSNTQASIALTVTAGASGAPAGFSIQWMTKAAFDAIGHVWPADTSSTTYCKASFSGVPYGAKNTVQAGINSYNLGANGSVTVYIGDLLNDELNQQLGLSTTVCNDGVLVCGTQYVFRAFAHGNSTKSRSAFSFLTDPCAKTNPCNDCGVNGGHHGFGYWKNTDTTSWPVNGLTIGGKFYTNTQLLSILKQTPNGNGLLTLGHQLITAELNGLCSNLTGPADAIFSGKTIPPVGTSSVTTASVAGLVSTLHKHNNDCLDCPAIAITN
ncbi:MAG: hypothetical protein JWP78_713 [Mucilaginibacter sp.]|nr:hypothetical protein [Mucilaginibacter sp.]